MESGTRAVNPAYASMDNTIVDRALDTIGSDGWTNYMEPKKAGDPLIWGWTSTDMEKADFPST